jgi:secreted Zn-dependent insulinase-like peptidase
MRTNQQLGYLVWSFNNRVEDRLFLKLVIQSATHGPFELKDRVENWMNRSNELFDKLSDDDFERYRQSLIVSLEKEGDSIAEVNGRLYALATRENGNFRFKKQLVKAVKKVSKEEIVAAARKILVDSQTPRIVILIRSKSNHQLPPEGVFTEVSQFKNRKSRRSEGK